MKKSYLNIILITGIFLSYSDYSYSVIAPTNSVRQPDKNISSSAPKNEQVDPDSVQNEPKTVEPIKTEESKSPDYFYLIIATLFLSLLALAASIVAIMQNNQIKEALKTKLTKANLKEIDTSVKTMEAKFTKDIENFRTSFTNVNKHFSNMDAKINSIEEKQKAFNLNNINKPILTNEFIDNSDLMSQRLNKPEPFNELEMLKPSLYQEPVKVRTYKDDLVEDFNSITFSDFRERYETKRIDVKNPEEIISNTNTEPIFIDREQGKYYIVSSENSDNSFYLIPGKSSDIKIDEISRKIFKFSKGYSEGSYSNWKIVEPSIVTFNNSSYTVNKAGKIEIQG